MVHQAQLPAAGGCCTAGGGPPMPLTPGKLPGAREGIPQEVKASTIRFEFVGR